MCDHRNPMHCIIPDYMLEELKKNPDPKVRDAAERTQAISDLFRSMRQTMVSNEAFGDEVAGRASRTIFDARNGTRLSGPIRRKEGDGPANDSAVDEAYDGLGATYDFFWKKFQRDSIDGRGLPLKAFVHYGRDYVNAFWDGAEMVFGDGDGVIFNRFTAALDVIAHELGHGVTQAAGGLNYQNQSGALNESMSDVFGSLVKQFALGEQTADEADWLIGAGLMVDFPCLRSMRDPHAGFQGGQPKHMNEYVRTNGDNGGVHINSGIPNHAFYLAAMALGGHAWERVGKVWYDTLLSDRIPPNCTFQQFADATIFFAKQNHGPNGAAHTAIWNAWEKVGIVAADKPSGTVPPSQPSTLKAELQKIADELEAVVNKI